MCIVVIWALLTALLRLFQYTPGAIKTTIAFNSILASNKKSAISAAVIECKFMLVSCVVVNV